MATAQTNLSEYDANKVPKGDNFRICLVVSEWNSTITEGLYEGAKSALLEHGVSVSNIKKILVPGSFELVYASKVAQHKGFNSVIAIGSVIQGETKHFDFVCNAVSQGIMELNITSDVPVIFCVLTDNTLKQAKDRSGGKHGNKGVEAAIAALKMAAIATTD